MARDGKIPVWEGMWLSSAILLPLGVFFTYKAVKDSAVFDMDAYKNLVRRLTGSLHRELEVKEFVMQEVIPSEAILLLTSLIDKCGHISNEYKALAPMKRLKYIFVRFPGREEAQLILNDTVDYLSNSKDTRVINLVNRFPFQLTTRTADTTVDTAKALVAMLEETSVSENVAYPENKEDKN